MISSTGGKALSPEGKKAWTVLAYIVADHAGAKVDRNGADIDRVAQEEATNMLRFARGRGDLNIAVQVDFTHTPGVLRIDPDGRQAPLTEAEAGGAEGLRDFIADTIRNFPADHYMLVLWGHGAGPVGLFDDPDTGAARPDVAESLSLRELREVLSAFGPPVQGGKRPLDILLVKSCCMATVEAAWEVRQSVDYLICSQAKVPIRTWTIWDDVLPKLVQCDHPESVATSLLEALDKHYTDALERNSRTEVPFTLLAAEGLGVLAESVRSLSLLLAPVAHTAEVQAALDQARPGETGDSALIDLFLFCTALERHGGGIGAAAAQVRSYLRNNGPLIREHRPAISAFHGISAFCVPPIQQRAESFADDVTSIEYRRLGFSVQTAWDRIAFAAEADPTPGSLRIAVGYQAT